MNPFHAVLRIFAVVIAFVALLHIALGTRAELLLGAHWPVGVPFDATLDSQDRFYGAAFVIHACVLWLSASDPKRFAPLLNAVLLVFFIGGLARLVSFAAVGPPAPLIYLLWSSELIAPPLLWICMRRLELR